MFTPQKPSKYPPTFRSPSTVRLNKGLFADGTWHCNCDPRLPATQFQVKKEGPNKGRWFYTCQESRENGCGFFLWQEDAAPREMGAVVNNTRSEADERRTTIAEGARDKRTVEGHVAASNKFMADVAQNNEDEYGSFELPPEMERAMTKVVEQAEMWSPETPRKAIKSSYAATPGSKRKREEDSLPTPTTGTSKTLTASNGASNDDDVFGIPSTTIQTGNNRFGFRSPSVTPSHFSLQREGTEATDDRGERTQQSYDITDEVMDLLRDQHIDEGITSNLKELLNKHALKISGISKGRDITRVALKAKDAKIAELQQRIAALEAERDLDKRIIRHYKSDMAQSVERRRGRGRGRG
ncbi:hypothetical protein L207DRAFT_528427 [Hyaloscypha variabilis F]|uniref:GRF-type domain-containing protein n=1 Tax=Hyaloscypha variabilis (strain UAMH 11265 / GT02V1 / F) TaxID=1149755 RepID=A0A2J6RTI1_HYAVF|nr:hypothetical protein L207DRAFT_528427 [Hyaloscypha variabilis F]